MGPPAHVVELRLLDASSSAETEWDLAFGVPETTSIIRLEVSRGRKFTDVLWNGFYPIVSRSVVQCLQENLLTGWRAYPTLFEGKIRPTEDYFVLGIYGRCDSIRVSDPGSPLTRSRLIRPGVIGLYGTLIIENVNGQEDFFMSQDRTTAFRCVSERAVRTIQDHKFRGCTFERCEEFEVFLKTASTTRPG